MSAFVVCIVVCSVPGEGHVVVWLLHHVFSCERSLRTVCSRLLLDMQINEDFDSPEIIVQVYPQEQLLEGVLNQNESTTYLQYMSSLYTAAQMEGMMNVHLLQLNAIDMPLTGWCASHPSAAADANIAAQLSAFIEAVLPEWTRTVYPLSVQV